MTETINAQIKSTSLGYGDHSIFSFYLVLDLQGGAGVTVGGYVMDKYVEAKKERIGTEYGMNVIKRILEVVGVRNWEELKGKYIRVENCGLGSRVTKIGNLMKEEWIDFDTFGKEFIK